MHEHVICLLTTHATHSTLYGLHLILPLKTVFSSFKCESKSENSLFCISMPEKRTFGNMLGKVGQSMLSKSGHEESSE